MSVVFPLWCVVCQNCGFVGTRYEKPGTAASYVKYCPSCGQTSVTYTEINSKEEHQKVKENEIQYDDII